MIEESGKLILAIAGIVILLLLAFRLIGLMSERTEDTQAKALMEELDGVIKKMQEGKTEIIFVESPKNWFLMNYKKDLSPENKPTGCGRGECLCLCPTYTLKDCKKKEICRSYETLTFTTSSQIFHILASDNALAEFKKVPFEIRLKKESNKIILDSSIYELENLLDEAMRDVEVNGKSIREILDAWLNNPDEKNIPDIGDRLFGGNSYLEKKFLELAKEREMGRVIGSYQIEYYIDSKSVGGIFGGFDGRSWFQRNIWDTTSIGININHLNLASHETTLEKDNKKIIIKVEYKLRK